MERNWTGIEKLNQDALKPVSLITIHGRHGFNYIRAR